MLFNEPKLLKSYTVSFNPDDFVSFSALQRAEIAEILDIFLSMLYDANVSVLFNEPKLLKSSANARYLISWEVSVLFNEPKLLKSRRVPASTTDLRDGFSALQRAEIAEIQFAGSDVGTLRPFQCSSTSRNC